MGKIKIYEIAKKLGLASKEVVEMAGKLNIEVKNHMSSVSEEDAGKIEKTLKNKVDNKLENAKRDSKTDTKGSKKEEKAPVIIRREVLIEEKNKEETKKQNKANNVGFVERKKDKDFNIVYRNKPTKPLTVSELFGLNKDSKKEEEPKKVEVQKKEVDNKTKNNEKDVIKEETNVEKKVEEVQKEEKKIEEKEKNIKELIKKNKIAKAIYVGDTKKDCESANMNGLHFIWAEYGFGKCDKYYKKIEDISELINMEI